MEILKDKKYGVIYAICCCIAIFLFGVAIFCLVLYINSKNAFCKSESIGYMLASIAIIVASLFGLMFAFRSMYGYLKIPLVLLEATDKIKIHVSKTVFVEVEKESILSVFKIKEKFSRSTYVIQIETMDLTYRLKDVMDLDESVKKLNDYLGK